MLYIFHVDDGRMLNFDMTVALSSVENLKDTIERTHGIPSANIVLLVSGGEMLTHSTQVSYYSAGTDTNPIYMFLTGDVKLPPVVNTIESDGDLREQVERSLELAAVYETVVKRAQLAAHMHDLAKAEDLICERLVHEQHLQQQGWSAVVANMEDLTEEFRQRFHNFCEAFDRHLEKRNSYVQLLQNFGDDLTKLSRIPILPGLMSLAEADFHAFDEFLNNDDVFSQSQSQLHEQGESTNVTTNMETVQHQNSDNKDNVDNNKSLLISPKRKFKTSGELSEDSVLQADEATNRNSQMNLLQWITSKENGNTLKTMSDECIQGLSTFNEEIYEMLKLEVQNIIKLAEQSDVKEIKGLGERLCKLEEFKYKIKKMVKDQKELSTAFQQNRNRANNLGDASILPDLCASHQSQLLVMLQNHQKIRDHRRCIAKAKDELGANLNARLKRIIFIENTMSEFDNRLLFYHRCLRRAERHIHIIEQIHEAPNMYVAAVTEVMRRKIFSTEFQIWASKLAEDFDSIHNEETKRREQFNSNFEGHFLNILFPGMNDMPPRFASENPLTFDARLPNITRSDVEILTTHLPEMSLKIQLPDMEPVIYFFVSRSGNHQRERFEELQKKRKSKDVLTKPTVVNNNSLLQTQRLVHLRKKAAEGEDSETDTETEFEQVPPPMQFEKSTATDLPSNQNMATLTDENYQCSNQEMEQIRNTLDSMSKLALNCINVSRNSLNELRNTVGVKTLDIKSELQMLNNKCNELRKCRDNAEKHTSNQLKKCEQELLELREVLNVRNNEIGVLQEKINSMDSLQDKCNCLQSRLAELNDKLNSIETEKAVDVQNIREQLTREHKTEIEALRQRFKLMTTIERSSSDNSLEKLDRPNVPDNHLDRMYCDAILAQQRSELEAEKEKAVNSAIEAERSIWQNKLLSLNPENVMANVTVLKELLEDKERQLNQLREKDILLTTENYQLKSRLDALINEDGNSWLREKIEYLSRDKSRLEEELNLEKLRRLEMESSIAAVKGSTYEQQGALPRLKTSTSIQRHIVIESCTKGDVVFVIWSMRHGQFIVVQNSPTLYFVHNDSLPALNLSFPHPNEESSVPVPYYAIGRVLEKEYCQARKDENRYRVMKGTKFYRIKLIPFAAKPPSRRERLEYGSPSTRLTAQTELRSEITKITSSTISNMVEMSATQDDPTLTKELSGGERTDDLQTSPITVITKAPSRNPMRIYKERTTSVTSIPEDDGDPMMLLSDHCHFTNVNEDNYTSAHTNVEFTSPVPPLQEKQSTILQQSVITGQPIDTASQLNMGSKMTTTNLATTHTETDLLLNQGHINTTTNIITTEDFKSVQSGGCSHSVTCPIVLDLAEQRIEPNRTSLINQQNVISSMPIATATTSEDSDEYRSLEPKDEADFPILQK